MPPQAQPSQLAQDHMSQGDEHLVDVLTQIRGYVSRIEQHSNNIEMLGQLATQPALTDGFRLKFELGDREFLLPTASLGPQGLIPFLPSAQEAEQDEMIRHIRSLHALVSQLNEAVGPDPAPAGPPVSAEAIAHVARSRSETGQTATAPADFPGPRPA